MAERQVARRKLDRIVWAREYGQELLNRGLEPMDVDKLSPRTCIQYTAAVGAMIVDEVTSITDNVSSFLLIVL